MAMIQASRPKNFPETDRVTDLMPDSPANPLAITVESTGDSITLFVSGQVDIENCQQLADALESATEGTLHAHVDLTEVDYMDSSGLRALLVARAAAEKTGGTVDITAVSTIVARLLEVTGLAELLAPPV